MADITKLSNEDLLALESGDISSLSDQGLFILSGETPPEPQSRLDSAITSGAEKVESFMGSIGEVVAPAAKAAEPFLESQKFSPQSIFMKARSDADTVASAMGKGVAETLAAQGINPHLAAAAGLLFSEAPNLIEGAAMGSLGRQAGRAASEKIGKKTKEVKDAFNKTAAKEAKKINVEDAIIDQAATKQKSAADTAKQIIGKKISKRSKEIEAKTKETISKVTESIKSLPEREKAVKTLGKSRLFQAKSELQSAEEFLKIDKKRVTPEMSSELAKNPKAFSEEFLPIFDKFSPEELSSVMPLERLQLIRKAASKIAKKSDSFTATNFFEIQKKATDAIAVSSKEFKSAMSSYNQAREALKAIPDQFKTKKNLLNSGLQKIKTLSMKKKLTDPELKSLIKSMEIVQRRSKELPARFANEKAKLNVALRKAEAVAEIQADLRTSALFKLGGVALAGAALTIGGGFVGKLMFGR